MSKKNWLILAVVGTAICLMAAAVVVVIGWFVIQGGPTVDRSLPVYTMEQVASGHDGYRRSILSSGSTVYVNDYDEYPLRLINTDPTDPIGRTPVGGGKICAIPGQQPTAYIAADVGSEMPAYAVFRNTQQAPFDWRNAKFQRMRLAMLLGPAANKLTTDPTLIDDVVRTLSEGVLVTAPSVVATNIHEVCLFSDQLPGLMFCPSVYIDPSGKVYLAQSVAIEDFKTLKVKAQWIAASPRFTEWAQTP
jgi:hypothetical protein